MKLGLVTDIHEEVELLRAALDIFQNQQVDQVVVLGDIARVGKRLDETCRLLIEVNAVGVWGNHDYGLSFEPDDEIRKSHAVPVIDYMLSLSPRLELYGCLFSHVEPWLNPFNISDLWYYGGLPDCQEKVNRIFDAVPNRIIFSGHYHRWILVTKEGIQEWNGTNPIRLSNGRYFVVIGAVCDGSFAIYNTDSTQLLPFNLE